MASIADEVGGSAMGVVTQPMTLTVRLIEKILETAFNQERKLAREQRREVAGRIEKADAIEALAGERGYKEFKWLQRTAARAGESLATVSVECPGGGAKDLEDFFKREGIAYAGVKFESDGKDVVSMAVCEHDLPAAHRALERYNDARRLEEINGSIKELAEKGADRTPEEDARLRDLIAQKDDLSRSLGSDDLNRDMESRVIGAALGEEREAITLDRALDRNTGRSIDQDRTAYVVDAKNPDRAIRCHAEMADDAADGKPYVRTEYAIFRRGADGRWAEGETFDDGCVGGKRQDWKAVKKGIVEAAGFSDTFYKFQTKDEADAWFKAYDGQNRKELSLIRREMAKPHMERDYAGMSAELDAQLEKDREAVSRAGYELKEGKVYASDTHELLPEIPAELKTCVAEAGVISSQQASLQAIRSGEKELITHQALMRVFGPGTEGYKRAEASYTAAKEKLEGEYAGFEKSMGERAGINAVQGFEVSGEERGRGRQEALDGAYADAGVAECKTERKEKAGSEKFDAGALDGIRERNGASGGGREQGARSVRGER